MNKSFKIISLVFAIFVLFSCSDDEGIRDLGKYGFNYNSQFYVLNTASYVDENVEDDTTPSSLSITLSNVNLTSSNAISNVTKLYFDFEGITLEAGEIADIQDYSLEIGGSFVPNAEDENYSYVDGTFLLNSESGLNATEKTVTITSLTESTISLTFSFTRADGQIFSGSYSGIFTDNSIVPE